MAHLAQMSGTARGPFLPLERPQTANVLSQISEYLIFNILTRIEIDQPIFFSWVMLFQIESFRLLDFFQIFILFYSQVLNLAMAD